MPGEHQQLLRQADEARTYNDTLLNAKSDIEATFEDANDAASGFVSALSQSDDALYRALQRIYAFVEVGENRPEEFETFKRAKGIKRPYNARSLFQHYVKYFIKANTDGKEIVGRASKYGAALDEAREQSVSGQDLARWIKDRGIENICKQRRRRNAALKPRPTPEVIIRETTDPPSASTEIAVLPSRDPLSDSNTRLVLKLNAQAQKCKDSGKRYKLLTRLDEIASFHGMDRESFVKQAREHRIFTRSLAEWGDDDRGREIGRLRVLLYRHSISW
jgi:hypothetical protein